VSDLAAGSEYTVDVRVNGSYGVGPSSDPTNETVPDGGKFMTTPLVTAPVISYVCQCSSVPAFKCEVGVSGCGFHDCYLDAT